MALIHCVECGREISSLALSCPHCGCPKEAQIQAAAAPLPETETEKAPVIMSHAEWNVESVPIGDDWEDERLLDLAYEEHENYLSHSTLQCSDSVLIDRSGISGIPLPHKKGELLKQKPDGFSYSPCYECWSDSLDP